VRRPCYQGKRFDPARAFDCSGKLLDVRISTIARAPAQPPIQDAAIIHHAEITSYPFFRRRVAGKTPAAALDSVCARQTHRLSGERHC